MAGSGVAVRWLRLARGLTQNGAKKNRRLACGFFIATPKLLLGVSSRGGSRSSGRRVSGGGGSRSRGFSSRGRSRGGFRGFLLAASGQGQGSDSGNDQGLFHSEFLSLDLVNDEFRAFDPVSIQSGPERKSKVETRSISQTCGAKTDLRRQIGPSGRGCRAYSPLTPGSMPGRALARMVSNRSRSRLHSPGSSSRNTPRD